MKKLLTNIYIYIYIQNQRKKEVQFTRTSNDRKWGDWYLVSSRPGGCL